DPISGRRMAERYREVVPNPDVVLLDDRIGHWPQIEDPEAVTRHFLAFIDRVQSEMAAARAPVP
ncbi:MAG: alpha/beta hydrolase, partial [Thermoleophilaceae bacterium]